MPEPGPFQVSCPGCSKALRVKAALAGKKLKCPLCTHCFEAQPPTTALRVKPTFVEPAAPPPRTAALVEPIVAKPVLPPTPKIAFTAAPRRRAPINLSLIGASVFASLSVYSLLVLLLLRPSLNPFAVTIFALAIGGMFAGFFATAVSPGDRLWQALYAGMGTGLVGGLIISLVALAQAAEASEGPASASYLAIVFAASFLPALFLLPVVSVLGGLLERRTMTLARRFSPAHEWIYETRSGRRINVKDAPRYPLQAGFWSACGWLFLFSWLLSVGSMPEAEHDKRTQNLVWEIFTCYGMFKICGVMARK